MLLAIQGNGVKITKNGRSPFRQNLAFPTYHKSDGPIVRRSDIPTMGPPSFWPDGPTARLSDRSCPDVPNPNCPTGRLSDNRWKWKLSNANNANDLPVYISPCFC